MTAVIEMRAVTPEIRRELAEGGILVCDTLPSNWMHADITPEEENSPFVLWSRKDHPPAIGDTVTLNNNFGKGVVLAYFTKRASRYAGYLGVLVDPLEPPEWWLARNKRGTLITAFGAELASSQNAR
jgi:hypothetical protein